MRYLLTILILFFLCSCEFKFESVINNCKEDVLVKSIGVLLPEIEEFNLENAILFTDFQGISDEEINYVHKEELVWGKVFLNNTSSFIRTKDI